MAKAKSSRGRYERHGLRGHPMYSRWAGMIDRCINPKLRSYRHYGARGITVCDRWRNSFSAFLADVGECPSPKHQLDRIDNDGNYEPGNVQWSTCSENCLHRRMPAIGNHIRLLTHDGQTLNVKQWAKLLGIPYGMLKTRLHRGWSVERALTQPSR